MAFKDYKRGMKRVEDQGLEFCRSKAFAKVPRGNFWWCRKKHPGWAAYHANKDQIPGTEG